MRYLILLILTQLGFCADLIISKDDISSYLEQYNAIAKESDHKIVVPVFLKIAHPEAPLFFMLKNIDLTKPMPANMKYGNKPFIHKFELLRSDSNRAVVLLDEENNKQKIAVFKRDPADGGVVKWYHEIPY